MKKIISFVLVIVLLSAQSAQAAYEPSLVNVNEQSNFAIIEMNGQKYKVDLGQPYQEGSSTPASASPSSAPADEVDYAELERQFLAAQASMDKYTGLPATVGTRLFTMPTDRLAEQGKFVVDFTHRFSGEFDDDVTRGELFGLDTFAYNSVGVHYGVTDWLELHMMRANVADMFEFGAKVKLLSETKKFSLTHPINLTLNTGFQVDEIQNSIDPYIQLIASRSIIPNRLHVFVAPTYAFRTNSFSDSTTNPNSAIFFSFADERLGRNDAADEGTFAVPIGVSFEVVKNRIGLVGEVIPVASGFYENNIGYSVGVNVLSKRETHIWTLGLTNMPYVTTGQSLVGGPGNEPHLGFNVQIFL